MAEKLHSRHEHDAGQDAELHKKHSESLKSTLEKGKDAHHEHADKIEQIRSKAEQEAKKAEHSTEQLGRHSRNETEQAMFVNRELKDMSYRRTLRRINKQLPFASRALSTIVHQPAVEAVSEVAAKTVARPSGVLAGGITAFLGSSIFLWIARHYGYEYNFLLFALLFIGGFFVGLLIELLLRLVRKR